MTSVLILAALLPLWATWLLAATMLGKWLKGRRQRTQRAIVEEALDLKPIRRWRHGRNGWRAPL